MSEIIPTHRHYKGGLYKFLHTAHSERNGDILAVYQSCETGTIWVRLMQEFTHSIPVNGEWVERFTRVGK